MTTQVRKPALLAIAAALLAAIGIGSSADAAESPSGWALKLDLGSLRLSSSGLRLEVGGITSDLEFDAGAGAGVRAEYRITSLLGLEFAVFSAASLDLQTSVLPGTVASRVNLGSITPVTAGLNVHLTREQPVDCYVGLQFGMMRYGSFGVRATTGGEIERASGDSEFAWGIILGLDVPIGTHGWSFQGSIRYLDAGMDHAGDDAYVDGEVNPTIVSVGIGFAF